MGLGRIDAISATFPVNAAIGEKLRVKFNTSGKLVLAGATDAAIGVTEHTTYAATDYAAVRLASAPSWEMTAAGAFTVGAVMYAAANGKCDDSGTVVIGVSGTASAADGDVVIVYPTK